MTTSREVLRANRTQEVSGSSPLSSTHKRPANAGLLSSFEVSGNGSSEALVKFWSSFENSCQTVPFVLQDIQRLPSLARRAPGKAIKRRRSAVKELEPGEEYKLPGLDAEVARVVESSRI
jgi:hypothetical protein